MKGEYGAFRQIIYLHTILLSVVGISLSKVASNYLPLLSLGQGYNLVRKILLVLLSIGIFFAFLLFFANPLICAFFNNPELKEPLYLFSGIIFFTIPTLGIEGIYASYKKTHILGIYTVFSKLLMFVLLVVPFFFIDPDLNTIIYFWLLQSIISFFIGLYLIYLPFKDVTLIDSEISITKIFRFIWPLVISSILGILFTSSDQYYISNYFGKEVYADFSNGSLQIPFIGILIGSIGSVLHPYFIEKINMSGGKQEIVATIKNSISKSVVLSYPIVLFILFSSETIFSVLFEEIYKNSSSFFRIIALYNLFSVFVLLPIIIVLKEVRFYNIIHVAAVFFVWGFQYLGLHFYLNPLLVPAVSLFAKILILIAFMVRIARRLNVRVTDMIPSKEIISLLLTCIIILAPMTYGKQFIETDFVGSLLYLIIGFIVYFGIVLISNKNFKAQLKILLGQFNKLKV